MQAVVPAAGEGTRLRPLTDDQPKGLVDVAGKPLLTHVFETLADLGVESIVVVVGYRDDDIRSYYGSSFEGIPLTYVTQDERLGLAHAVLQAAPNVDGEFLLMNGDNVFDADLSALVARHRATDADATTLVEQVSRERARAGGVFNTEDDEVVGLIEKPDEPPSQLIPRGVYAFSQTIFSACRLVTPGHTGEYELSDAVDLLIQAGRRVETVEFEEWCCNVNTPADCERVAAHFESS
jgi:glucose-1-phosphate thymidylyltransferase